MLVFWLSLLDVETYNFYNRHEVRVKSKVFLLITLLTPISFFVLLELALRLFNYGDQSQPMFISDPFDPEYSIMNPAVAIVMISLLLDKQTVGLLEMERSSKDDSECSLILYILGELLQK
mgnify:CR=1 FL=1